MSLEKYMCMIKNTVQRMYKFSMGIVMMGHANNRNIFTHANRWTIPLKPNVQKKQKLYRLLSEKFH